MYVIIKKYDNSVWFKVMLDYLIYLQIVFKFLNGNNKIVIVLECNVYFIVFQILKNKIFV